eukprot:gnl/MRDRNA2_/MRDRNA2_42622_c0_seq1.p1 gnl/MRDRNA2_/MRDRNA2_42622_c0~~gnl/MRDRNA2_/MRDRNA2_42622_c0_seq1.p1  ORF type:complete len:277 (+),score=30.10 gnl/MRDRNA2_/MRDRNA2_42622_c0_seq1:161-991(+)
MHAVVLASWVVVTSAQNITGCPNRRSYATCFCDNTNDHKVIGGGARCGSLVNCPPDYADGCQVFAARNDDEEAEYEQRLAQNMTLPHRCMKATWVPNDLGDGEYVFEGQPDPVVDACVMPPAQVAEMTVCPWLELPAVVTCQCHSEELGYHECGILARCPMETLDLPHTSAKCIFFLDEGTGVMGGPPGRYYCHAGFGHGGIASIYPIHHPKCCLGANFSGCTGFFRKGQLCEGEDDWCYTPLPEVASYASRMTSRGCVFLFLALLIPVQNLRHFV